MNVRVKSTNSTVCTRCIVNRGAFSLRWLLFLVPLLLLTSCDFGGQSSAADVYQPIRSPYPTFTPAPVGLTGTTLQPAPTVACPCVPNLAAAPSLPVAQVAPTDTLLPPAATPAAPAETTPAEAPTPAPNAPRLVVNSPLVNVRAGPGTTYAVLATVERGQEYDIIGKNGAGDWWRFCCINDEPAWVIGELVDVDGDAESAPVSEDTPADAPTAAPRAPRLVINAPLVNVRTGPGTTYTVLTTVERGQTYDIVGKNAAGDWWRFCCINNEPAWVTGELVTVAGAAELAPVSEAVAQAPPTTTPAPPAAAPTQAPPAEPAAPEFQFELVSAEQFSEPKLVRVFLYVYSGEDALAGYTIRVKKDGAEQSVSGASFGGQPGLTWPLVDVRQRFQNLKIEFPNVPAAGLWEIQLVDGGGNPVGPPATFTLNANDPNQELYVRYKKR